MNDFETLFEQIGELARRRYLTAERHFAGLGLNHSEARLLTLLDREGGSASQETLSRLLLIDRTNAGRALKRLEREGYISRHPDETDKRAKSVRITGKGSDAVADIARLRAAIIESFFGDLTDRDAKRLVALLSKIPSARGED